MTRGKYATGAEARRARETAISEAATASKERDRATAENADLKAEVAELKAQVAAGVSADLHRAEARLKVLDADLRAARDLLRETRKAIIRTYEETIRILQTAGNSLEISSQVADTATTFLVGDELIPAEDVAIDWAVNTGHLVSVRKRNSAERTQLTSLRKKHQAAYDRISQGIE
jgi:hypothetical protein